MKKLLILFIVTAICMISHAQEFKKKILLDNLKDNIIEVFEDESDKLVCVFSNNHGPIEIEGWGKTYDIKSGLLLSNGEKINFDEFEFFKYSTNNYLFTTKYHHSESKVEIRKYELKNNKLKLLKSKNLGFTFYISEMINDGDFVYTDFDGSFGREIQIYSGDLELLKAHKLNGEKGFDGLSMGANDEQIFVMIKPTWHDSSNSKIFIFDTKTGNLITKKVCDEKIESNMVYPINDKFVVKSGNRLICFDTECNELWDKNIATGPYEYCISSNQSKNILYISNSEELFFLNIKNGEFIKQIPFSNLFPAYQTVDKNINGKSNWYVIEQKYFKNQNILAMVAGKCEARNKEDIYYKEIDLIFINLNGEIVYKERLKDSKNIYSEGFTKTVIKFSRSMKKLIEFSSYEIIQHVF